LAGVALLPALPASADTTPPWEPDPNAIGTLSFYDASGNPVTGGADLDHLFDYALASTDDPASGGDFANLEFANPTPSEDSGLWPTAADESSATPNASAPGALGTSTHPLVTLDSTGAELNAAKGGFAANTTAGYVNAYQVRLYTTDAAQYWEADVLVNTGDGTWVETYPTSGAAPTATSTQLTASPVTSALQGQQVTFTATETADDNSHPAGSVQFYDGNQALGTAVAVDSNGVATVMTSTLLPGTHTIKADFTTTASGYSSAPEATLSYLVNPVAAKPTIVGTVQVGKTVTCHETTTSGETATYQWDVNGSKVATGHSFTIPGSDAKKSLTCKATVNVSGGTASSATSAAKTIALGAALKVVKKPTLSGKGTVGSRETCNHGTWSPRATSYHYQWYVGTKAIKGATKSTYVLTRAEKGKKVSCKVTAIKTGYAHGTARTSSVTVKA
jgi:hypothetical protein